MLPNPEWLSSRLHLRMQSAFHEEDRTLNFANLAIWYNGLHAKTHYGAEVVIQMATDGVSCRQYLDVVAWDTLDIVPPTAHSYVVLSNVLQLVETLRLESSFQEVEFTRYVLLPSSIRDGNNGNLMPLRQRQIAGPEISFQNRISFLGHTAALLDTLVHSENLVTMFGIKLCPPRIHIVADAGAMGYRCQFSTVYNHPDLEVWYSTDGTIPRRKSSKHWKGESFLITQNMAVISAVVYFQSMAPSQPAQARQTELHIAAQRGDSERVHALLTSNAAVDAVNLDGMTALHLATQFNRSECVASLLMEYPMTQSRGDTTDDTISKPELTFVRANVNASSADGSTALHFAAYSGDLDTVNLLLDGNADILATTNAGTTVLQCASRGGHTDVCTRLRDVCVERNQVDTMRLLLHATTRTETSSMCPLPPYSET
eukprot:m.412493 g.412493  ORF g.412493 m.412493 type:complete len:429 (+) comp21256_c0_seq6:2566-3852(+)